jgi:hypothetical protein
MIARLLSTHKELDLDGVHPGAVYSRVRINNMVETAKVTSIANDSLGIPHVYYEVIVGYQDRLPHVGEARVLALQCFAERYVV